MEERHKISNAIIAFSGTVFFLLTAICYVIFISTTNETVKPSRPHIIFILADDLGWNDVSFHGSPQIPTPNLDALAASGILLNNYYAERLCTPSRAALLTGKYPIRLGLQHFVIRTNEPSALPLEEKTMAQYLKELGYATHMVGKWHLGYHKKEYTPTYRGFDTFFGYYNAYIDHYDYTHSFPTPQLTVPKFFFGIDLQDGSKVVKDVRGQYATDLFTEKAKNIIQNHDESQPLFLYLSHLAVHLGNSQMLLQAPPNLVKRFDHIKNDSRKIFAGMVSALDESVGDVFQALHQKGMLLNTIFVFSSDNGGEMNALGGYSSNYPLRGTKWYVWEGGIRVPGFIWSPLLNLQEPRVSMQLMHITDWLPTLYSAAGGDVKRLGNVDGKNMWEAFLDNTPSPRQDVLHNIDPIDNISALRMGNFKLLTGNIPTGIESWSGHRVLEGIGKPTCMDEWVYKNGSTTKGILEQLGSYLPKVPDAWREQSVVLCKRSPETSNKCSPDEKPCLFNIIEDPCETTNIADLYPELVQSMLDALKVYEKQAVKPQSQDPDPHGDPICHGFAYVPWMDSEHIVQCPFK